MVFRFLEKASQHTIGYKTGLGVIAWHRFYFVPLMGIGGGAINCSCTDVVQVNIRKAIGCAALAYVLVAIFRYIKFCHYGRWKNPELPEVVVGYVYLPANLWH